MLIKKKGKTLLFKCNACECEFAAGIHAIKNDDGNFYCSCPECGAECHTDWAWQRTKDNTNTEKQNLPECRFCGKNWTQMDGVLSTMCQIENRVKMTSEEQDAYDIAIQCIAEVMNRMVDGKEIDFD